MKQVPKHKDVFIEIINQAYIPSEMKEDYINLISQSAGAKKGKTLDELCDMALKQIEDKKYEAELLSAGFDKEKIIKLAFAFEGKEVLIKRD